jgi:hypothetical protein
MELYEILVPTVRPDGRPISTRFHRVWDEKVRAVSGGLTVLHPVKGQWVAPCGTLFAERMIPVRIACSREQIDAIADMAAKYYQQQAILYWKVSSEVVIHAYDKDRKYARAQAPGRRRD